MSTGRLPSIEGMMVRLSPPPVIARIRDWFRRIWSTLTPCTPLAPMANPGTAVPPTTLVQAATSNAALTHSSERVNLPICHPSAFWSNR